MHLFGEDPFRDAAFKASLTTQAPSALTFHLPASLVKGCEFVVTATLSDRAGGEGSVQAQVVADQVPVEDSLIPGLPVLARKGGAARSRVEKSFDEFRRVFPAAVCYSQVVPVDEVVTLALYHREDEPLMG